MPKVRIERRTDWVLSKANAEDEGPLRDFYKQSTWKNKDDKAVYGWKFEKNPQGEALIIAGKNSERDIVASNVFMPWKFSVNRTIFGAFQWVDTVISIPYRGQNITTKSLEIGKAFFEGKGAHVCFAFPNQNGVLGHKENGGFHLGCIERYTKPLHSEYIISRVVKIKLLVNVLSSLTDMVLTIFSREMYCLNLGGYKIENVNKSITDLDQFWEKISGRFKNKIMTIRNSCYLLWKYSNAPNNNRQLYILKKGSDARGFVVLESGARIGYVVDILGYDDDALDQLISFSIRYFRKQGHDSVVFVALENNMYFKRFKKFGFVRRPEEKHFYIYLDEAINNKQFFMDSNNWFITIGDCDIETM